MRSSRPISTSAIPRRNINATALWPNHSCTSAPSDDCGASSCGHSAKKNATATPPSTSSLSTLLKASNSIFLLKTRLNPATGLMRSPFGFSGWNEKIGPVCTRFASTASTTPTSNTGATSEMKEPTRPAIQPLLLRLTSRSAELTNRSRASCPSSRQAEAPQIIARRQQAPRS